MARSGPQQGRWYHVNVAGRWHTVDPLILEPTEAEQRQLAGDR